MFYIVVSVNASFSFIFKKMKFTPFWLSILAWLVSFLLFLFPQGAYLYYAIFGSWFPQQFYYFWGWLKNVFVGIIFLIFLIFVICCIQCFPLCRDICYLLNQLHLIISLTKSELLLTPTYSSPREEICYIFYVICYE